jgi:hypothetical protein
VAATRAVRRLQRRKGKERIGNIERRVDWWRGKGKEQTFRVT